MHGSNRSSDLPAWDTPVWDKLFQTVHEEDPSGHLLSIHNNAYLYNYRCVRI